MILVSSHLDRVVQDFSLAYRDGSHVGLLDNFAGVLLTYLVLYDDVNVRELEREGKIRFWHGKGEEWGRLDATAPKLGKQDLVVVVDVAAGKQYRGHDFAIENVSGMSDSDARDLCDDLKWQGFKFRFAKYTGKPVDEDEAWQWRKRGVPVISFIIPIEAVDDGRHRVQMDNRVSAERMATCRQALKRVLNHLAG